MSLYEPLREGFRELNRMLVDRQQFNAQMQTREHQQNREDQLLVSNLTQRDFQNTMASRQQEFNENNKAVEITRYEQQDKYQKERDVAKDKIEKDKIELQNKEAKSMAEHRQKQEGLWKLQEDEAKLELQIKTMKATDLVNSIKDKPATEALAGFGFLEDEQFIKDTDAMNAIAQQIGANRYDPEKGQFVDLYDQEFKTSEQKVYDRKVLLENIYESATNTSKEVATKYAKKKEEFNKLSSLHNFTNKSNSPAVQLKAIEQKVALKELQKEMKELEFQLSPNARAERLEKRIRLAESAAVKFAKLGKDKDSEAQVTRAAALRKSLEELQKDFSEEIKSGTQKEAVLFDEDGEIMASRMFTVPKGLKEQGIRPQDLDQDGSFAGDNVLWLDTYKEKFKGRVGNWDHSRPIADENMIKREINQKFGSTTLTGSFVFDKEKGSLVNMAKYIAAQLSSDKSHKSTAIPELAVMELENTINWYENALAEARMENMDPVTGIIDEEAAKEQDAITNEILRERIGAHPLTQKTINEFRKWLKSGSSSVVINE